MRILILQNFDQFRTNKKLKRFVRGITIKTKIAPVYIFTMRIQNGTPVSTENQIKTFRPPKNANRL